MKTVEASTIRVEDRQRKEIAPSVLRDLKNSIAQRGLLHAIVLSLPPDGSPRLVAGETRLKAMMELHNEGHTFTYDNQEVPEGQVPYTTVGELSAVELWELELEENILRAPLHWREEAEAKAKIHQARQALNPKQSVMDTAKELAIRTAQPVETVRKELAASVLVSKHLDDPQVQSAKNLREAHRVVLDKAEAFFKAELARRTTVANTPHKLIHGDCLEVLRTLPLGTFDCILSDPPYGILANKMKKDTAHYYDDSIETALNINKFILAEGFRLTKRKAVAFLFCDIEHFITLREFATQQAWVPWRTPIIWYKGADGHAPWGRAGFTRTYEAILFCVKGQRELMTAGGPDVINISKVTRGERVHAAEKPFDLIYKLLSSACIQGDTVLDPCCGSGSIFPVASKLKLQATGIEKDKTYYDLATVKLGETVNGGTQNLKDLQEALDCEDENSYDDFEDEEADGLRGT